MEKFYGEKGEIAWGNQIRSYVFHLPDQRPTHWRRNGKCPRSWMVRSTLSSTPVRVAYKESRRDRELPMSESLTEALATNPLSRISDHSLFENKTWRYSPEAFPLSSTQIRQIEQIGRACCEFQGAGNTLRSAEGRTCSAIDYLKHHGWRPIWIVVSQRHLFSTRGQSALRGAMPGDSPRPGHG